MRVPRVSAPTEIALGHALRLAFLEVAPESRVLLPHGFLRQAAVQQEQAAVEQRMAVLIGRHFVRQEARARQQRPQECPRQAPAFHILLRENEEPVVSGDLTAFDGEKARQPRRFRLGCLGTGWMARPLRLWAKRIRRHQLRFFRLFQGAPECERDLLTRGRLALPVPDHCGRHESVRELGVSLVEPMHAQQHHFFYQVTLHRLPVADVHKLAWNQPTSKAAIGQPIVRERHEVAIETSQAAEFDAAGATAAGTQAVFLAILAGQVVVADVRRVADEEIALGMHRRRRGLREVREPQLDPRPGPKPLGRQSVVRIDLVANGVLDAALAEDVQERRVERASANGGIEKAQRPTGG